MRRMLLGIITVVALTIPAAAQASATVHPGHARPKPGCHQKTRIRIDCFYYTRSGFLRQQVIQFMRCGPKMYQPSIGKFGRLCKVIFYSVIYHRNGKPPTKYGPKHRQQFQVEPPDPLTPVYD